jgi:hypothetical protein
MRGFIVAPKTTRYRFYMACDDYCQLNMALNSADPTNMTNVIANGGWTEHRDYIRNRTGKTLVSDWISLTQGQSYAVEAKHIEGWGSDYMTVSVELE